MLSVHQSQSDPTLSITTLGAAFVTSGRDRVASARTLGPGKPLALLVYLAFSPGRAATRDALVDLLWADVEPDDGRHALRQTIWYIKKNLGESTLAASRDVVRIDVAVESDRDAFLEAVQGEQFENAVSLYRGEFFPEFAQPGALEFEHWADLERQRLRSAFLRAGQAVVRSWLAVARHKDAVKLARRLRDTDRSEANWRLLLECLVAARDQLGATLEADALEQFIARDEREPEPATRAMLRLVQQAPEPAHSGGTTALAAALIGRESEFAALVSGWDRAREHASQHVHLAGGAGIGKTRLIVDFAARLRSQRSRVAFAGARLGERMIPYSLASEVVGALAHLTGAAGIGEGAAASLIALNPSLSTAFSATPDSSQGDEALRRRTIALRELIAAVADERPLAILVDDWHWADDASQRLIGSAIQRLAGERVLIVTAGRPGYMSPEGPHTRRVPLSPLTLTQVGAVIGSVAQLPDESWCDELTRAVHDASGGSPLLVLETIQWLIDRGVATIERGEWRLGKLEDLGGIGQSGSAVRQRLASLDLVDREAIASIAVAGVPVGTDMLRGVTRTDRPELLRRIEQLEHRGFLVRAGESWNVAHDVIAESALDGLTHAERRDMEQRVGAVQAASAGRDCALLMQAGQHSLRAGDVRQAAATFVRWVRELRADGDERTLRVLALEFAGSAGESTDLTSLVTAVPIGTRFTATHRRASIAFGTLAVFVAAFAWLRPAGAAPPSPDVRLVAAFERTSGDTVTTSVELRAEDLTRLDVIDVASLPASKIHVPMETAIRTLSPDGRRWAGSDSFTDSGGIELITIEVGSGAVRRLTHRSGDDEQPSWSPTGDALVFSTGGFSPLARNDLAILDLKTNRVRQLTKGDETDASPVWNPRGDRIAFTRRYWTDGEPNELCLVTLDGITRCQAIAGFTGLRPVAWYDSDHLIVEESGRADRGGLAVVDINSFTGEWIYRGEATLSRVSPDGRYVACLCTSSVQVARRWKLFSVNDPTNASTDLVRGRIDNERVALEWIGPPRRPENLTRLRVDSRSDTIPLDVPYQVRALGVDASDRTRSLGTVTWQSSDPRIATVDSTGLIHPLKRGTVRIDASAGGSLVTHKEFAVGDLAPLALLSIDWARLNDPRIIPYGEPMPSVVVDERLGPALVTNGDSSFTSGFMTAAEVDAQRGIAVEVLASMPITMVQWQSLGVGLYADIDSGRVMSWDRRTGPIPGGSDAVGCEMGFPYGSGPHNTEFVSVGAQPWPAPANLASGRPVKILVQLFPDGRCGAAIDGVPIGLEPTRRPRDPRYRVMIGGYSSRARILVGSVHLWSGVKPGIDWSRLKPLRRASP